MGDGSSRRLVPARLADAALGEDELYVAQAEKKHDTATLRD
jgi:hypothetical protein